MIDKLKFMIRFMSPKKIRCYVLIGYYNSPDSDLHRIETLKKLKIDPYVMPYDRKDPYQKAFQKWVNGHVFRKVKWEDFKW